jgi:hypothetical protein
VTTEVLLADQLSQVISHSTAPAFLLGAVAGFLSVVVGRLNRIVDRCTALTSIEKVNPTNATENPDLPRLRRRANLMNRAVEFAVAAGIFTTLLVIVAFASAFLGFAHAYGAAVLFVIALLFFAASLIALWLEVRIALKLEILV